MTRDGFLAIARHTAAESSRTSGLPAEVTVAQAILESNWGESQLAREGNNFFGIKAHGKHPAIELPTLEHVAGRNRRTRARFARYASMEECFACRDRLIAYGARYAEARGLKDDPEQFARALAEHWATDPRYAEKLIAVYRSLGSAAC